MKIIKRCLSISIIVALLACILMMSTVSSSASGTGAGLAEWALNAYNSKWSYVYGGATPGAVDCSGLIYSYAGGQRTGDAQLYNSNYTGSVSSGMPRIHGLGLWKPGHVGVYVGDEMAVDARGSQYGVCYESVYSHGWTTYFKVPGVSYPKNGWVTFNGSKYYYQNGQYVVNTTKTIDGVAYTFGSNGKVTLSTPSSGSTSSTTSVQNSSSLKLGSTGAEVERLQTRLSELGYYDGAIDGDFGVNTERAFKLFQEKMGLYVDGIAGSDVDYLYAKDAPKYEKETIIINNKKEETEIASTSVNNDETEVEEEVPTSFQKGDYHDQIYKLQERLIELSYYEGTADGSFGSITEEAIIAFQSAHGLTQTGIADELTIEKIYSDDAITNPVQEDPTEFNIVDSELPQSAAAGTVTATEAKDTYATEVTLETNELSGKALASVASSMGFKADENGNNFQFIFWLAVMIVVMLFAFMIVNIIEKKKTKKATSRYF